MAWKPVSYGSGLPGPNIGRQIEGFGEALFQRQQRRAKEERQKQYQIDLEAAGASNDPNASKKPGFSLPVFFFPGKLFCISFLVIVVPLARFFRLI